MGNFGQRLHNSRRRFYRRQLLAFYSATKPPPPLIICIIWQAQESTNYDRVPELDVKAIFWRVFLALFLLFCQTHFTDNLPNLTRSGINRLYVTESSWTRWNLMKLFKDVTMWRYINRFQIWKGLQRPLSISGKFAQFVIFFFRNRVQSAFSPWS